MTILVTWVFMLFGSFCLAMLAEVVDPWLALFGLIIFIGIWGDTWRWLEKVIDGPDN